ncbi:MAG: protein kinase [Rhodothermales bacterium]|nr:protein kinase [Rhodothermales bacterium]
MIGETISHYRITGQLGRGGMGIVYEAEDTKLDRTVAIKVLPPAALVTEDDRARFYREAKAAAQLTHPHIAAVYEIDEAVPSGAPHGTQPSPFIAMEYIPGETLAEHIAKGPMKLKDAVRISSEVAEALKAAHGKEIVHRDIKSGNVMLDAEGRAKVLDFGLAKTTHSTMLTQMGSTLGTVAFMSPEQARGEDVDYRSDLWSLGIMLYEMVAGRLPYGGDYEQAVVYAILNEAPEPLTAVRSGVPMGLEWIVSKCLAKDPADRYQSASDLVVDLRNVDLNASGMSRVSTASGSSFSAVTSGAHAMPAPVSVAHAPASTRKKTWFWPAIAGALLVAAGLGYAVSGILDGPQETAPLLRVQIPLDGMSLVRFPALSPTKEYLAFQGADSVGREGVFLREMATGAIRLLEGSEIVGGRELAFSPDGGRLAFTTGFNGGVFSVVLPSGIPERQTDRGRMIAWEDDTTILFVDDSPGGKTYRKALGTSVEEEITLSDPSLTDETVDIIKTIVPGSSLSFGHQFVRTSVGGYAGVSKIFAADLKTGRVDLLESTAMNPEYVNGGFLMYQQRDDSGLLVVRRVDKKTGQFVGQPRDVLPESASTVWSQYSITADGDLLYQYWDTPIGYSVERLFIADLDQRSISRIDLVMSANRVPASPNYSPDDKEIALALEDDNSSAHIVVLDIETGTHLQKTFGDARRWPTWTADGKVLYYTGWDGQIGTVYRRLVDGTGTEEVVLAGAARQTLSANGRWLAAVTLEGARTSGLGLLELRTGDVAALDTTGSARRPSFSPDSRYVAYDLSSERGRRVMIRPVVGEALYEVPDLVGRDPVWSADGNYLYVVSSGIRRIPIRTTPEFQILGAPELVVSTSGVSGFDITRDGSRLAITATAVNFGSDAEQAPSIVWLQNWSSYLDRVMGR